MSAAWGGLRRLIVGRSLPQIARNCSSGLLTVKKNPLTVTVLCRREFRTSTWLLAGGCKPCSIIERSRLWKLLESLGVDKCRVIKLRRSLKKYSYPWLSYSIPAALILGTGDLLAQYYCAHAPSLSAFFEKCYLGERTLVYMLKGLLLVGPVLSWWNLFWFRKLRCRKQLTYILVKTFLDVFVLAPILVSLMALIYDQTIKNNIFNTDWEVTKERMKCRYIPAIAEVLAFNALTRPVMVLLVCYIIPPHLRRTFRVLYETAFAAFISHTFAKHELRCPPKPPKSNEPKCDAPPPDAPAPAAKVKKPKKNLWKWPC